MTSYILTPTTIAMEPGNHNRSRITTRKLFAINKDKSNNQAVRDKEQLIDNHPGKQSYSSRNCLRAATSNNIKQKFPPTMPSYPNFNHDCDRGYEKNSHHNLLDNDSFVRIENRDHYDELVCLLCATRELIVDQSIVDNHLLSCTAHGSKYYELRCQLLDLLPDDSSIQMNALSEFLEHWYQSQMLTDDMLNLRLEAVEEFGATLNSIDSECQYRIIGSLAIGTSLITSDVNIELLHKNSSLFKTDPRAKNSIHHKLVDPHAEMGFQLNNHTLYYDLISNAVITLDKLRKSILDRYQCLGNSSFEVISKTSDLNNKVPKLILNHTRTQTRLQISCYVETSHKLATLLRTYLSLDERACILSVLVRYWAKICRIDNPESGTFSPDTLIILVIYFLQRTSPPILPCIHETLSKNSSSTRNNTTNKLQEESTSNANANNELEDSSDEEDDDEDEDYTDIEAQDMQNLNWYSWNNSPIHKLFVEFFKFMIEEFDNSSTVITIRTLNQTTVANKGWIGKVKAIENPLKPKINLSRCIGTLRTQEYIKKSFRNGYFYLTSLPIGLDLKPRTEDQQDPRDFIELYFNAERMNSYFLMKKDSIPPKKSYDTIAEMMDQNLFARDVEVTEALMSFGVQSRDSLFSIVARAYNENLLVPRDVSATLFCWLCRKIGHQRKTCPSYKIENLQKEYLSRDRYHLDMEADLDPSFRKMYEQNYITTALSCKHQKTVEELCYVINDSTDLNCKLELFGSTVNNLGSSDSDLDICMTLKGNVSGAGLDFVNILTQVFNVLSLNEKVYSIEPILTARVPILKFRYDVYDIDLSMYNKCAIYNSHLLREYSRLDERVAQLFFLVKKYAKACGIADASRGSLSSYAWSLMVIHYLQKTSPIILPVLQETETKEEVPLVGVNGWNVWFREDYEPGPKQTNRSSLTQLFKGFFLYYGTFNFELDVVSIRKSNLITKYQKNWHNCMIAIEDPFELTYNLAGRLDDPMALYIMNSFSQAYRQIVRYQESYLRQSKRFMYKMTQSIFNGREITGTTPPFRGCRFCHRIGHKIKDCPEKDKPRRDNNRFRENAMTRPITRS